MSTSLQPMPFGAFTPDGDSALRGKRLLARLQTGKFRPAALWTRSADPTWPGDMEGRTVLAQVLLSQALGTTARDLDAHWQAWPGHLNRRGYFGTDHGDSLDEQQLSSHGWVLRALCEGALADPSRSGFLQALIGDVVANLALPNADAHASYPIDHRDDVSGGSHSGTASNRRGRWILSTDIGCDWIFLDGLVQAHDLCPDPRLASLIDSMIDRFAQADPVRLGMQTHATLTALRGCLRRAGQTGDAGLIHLVRERYAHYRAHGMTANWANHNWFGRPRWTEPCAMVDALQLAVGLWQVTRDPAYLGDAHRFWHSALGHGQRANGGFGPDTCCGADQARGGSGDLLGMSVYEAHWCCSMRGGEGIARVVQSAWFSDGTDLLLCLPQPGNLTLADGLRLRLDTAWPRDGRLRLEVLASASEAPRTLRIFVPPNCSPGLPRIGGEPSAAISADGFLSFTRRWCPGDVLELDLAPQPVVEAHGDGRMLWHGPLLLAASPDGSLPADPVPERTAPGLWRCGDVLLTPVDDVFSRSDLDADRGEAWKGYRRRVIFR